jgi:Zn-dependent M28 family amino/carboxypeptidase
LSANKIGALWNCSEYRPYPPSKPCWESLSGREQGLLGAEEYVDSLSAAERAAIRFMISVDLVGSPNFVRFVYDGDNSAFPMPQAPPGSMFLERLFLQYFECVGLAVEPTPFDGRSDYQPFLLAGIPV